MYLEFGVSFGVANRPFGILEIWDCGADWLMGIEGSGWMDRWSLGLVLVLRVLSSFFGRDDFGMV